jgi:2-phospho-L-lactate guanylyltransferase
VSALPVIIPVKALSDAKLRLAELLAPEERAGLVLAMLADMLETLAHVARVGPVHVVTPDAKVAALAEAQDAIIIAERSSMGLNGAIERGLCHPGVRSMGRALILPGDVPFASAGEILAVAQTAGPPGARRVTIVPARDGRGTNALLLAPLDIIDPQFGPWSFAHHLSSAVARRADLQVLQLPGLASDIDTLADLEELRARRRSSPRYAFLRTGAATKDRNAAHE